MMLPGDRPEPFSLPSTAGGDWSPSPGKTAVLAFFPAAFTGG